MVIFNLHLKKKRDLHLLFFYQHKKGKDLTGGNLRSNVFLWIKCFFHSINIFNGIFTVENQYE